MASTRAPGLRSPDRLGKGWDEAVESGGVARSAGDIAASTPVTQVILSRGSVREGFTERPVPDEVMADILRCGLAAPSSKGARPWRLHVVARGPLIQDIADKMHGADGADTYVPHDPVTGAPWPQYQSTVSESAQVLRECTIAVFVENRGVFSRGRATLIANDDKLLAQLVGYGLELMGIGASIQNMLLAAASHGLKGVFMGDVLIADDVIRARLGMDGDPQGVLAFGYSPIEPASRSIADLSDPMHVVWHQHS